MIDPLDLQSYDRYSYVENRPLSSTDPSGWNPNELTPNKTWIPGFDGGDPSGGVMVTGRKPCGDSCIAAIKAMLLASAEQARKAAKHWRVVVPVVRSVVRFGGGMAGGIAGGAIATGCATVSGGLCSPLAPGIVLGSRWAGQEGAVLAFDAVLNATVGAEQPAEGLSTGASDGHWEVPQEAKDKIPAEWGEGEPNRKGEGQRWEDPNNKGNGVRIDKGNPDNSQPSQQVDHVVVRDNGRVIGRDGQPIKGAIKDNGSEAHVPLSEWANWSSWNKP